MPPGPSDEIIDDDLDDENTHQLYQEKQHQKYAPPLARGLDDDPEHTTFAEPPMVFSGNN